MVSSKKVGQIMRRRESTDTFLFISHTTNVLLFKSRCNIFIGFRIIKEMPGLVGSGTPCISLYSTCTGSLFYLAAIAGLVPPSLFPALVGGRLSGLRHWDKGADGKCQPIVVR